MRSILPILVRASDPNNLREQVEIHLQNGRDLYTPLMADGFGGLFQWMAPSSCLYEYGLINAVDLDDMELQVMILRELGFDFMFNAVIWNGRYLQWMARMKTFQEAMRDAEVVPAPHADELQLVEDVRAELQLERKYSLAIPFPLWLS